MNYRQKTINSMVFFLERKFDGITKLDAIKELSAIWSVTPIKDMVKAYNIYNEQ